MTGNQSQVSDFDVNKRKGRFSFVSSGNRCICAELGRRRRVEIMILVSGVPSLSARFLIDQSSPHCSPIWWAGSLLSSGVCLSLLTTQALPAFTWGWFCLHENAEERCHVSFKTCPLRCVSVFVQTKSDFRSGENLLTRQWLSTLYQKLPARESPFRFYPFRFLILSVEGGCVKHCWIDHFASSQGGTNFTYVVQFTFCPIWILKNVVCVKDSRWARHSCCF